MYFNLTTQRRLFCKALTQLPDRIISQLFSRWPLKSIKGAADAWDGVIKRSGGNCRVITTLEIELFSHQYHVEVLWPL